MSALPESYTDYTQCCARCAYGLILRNWDGARELFCTLVGSPCPGMIYGMDETMERAVQPWGRCDHFELAEDADARW